ncbi:MAG: diacylglyceryl transferase, partial [Opitutae bacterium]
MKILLGKLVYGLTFCVVLPALLYGWAQALGAKYPTLPMVSSPAAGLLLMAAGGSLLVRGMWELWTLGGGLPMNAFPPERFVTRGLYGWLPHPIYCGFALLMFGLFCSAGMPA